MGQGQDRGEESEVGREEQSGCLHRPNIGCCHRRFNICVVRQRNHAPPDEGKYSTGSPGEGSPGINNAISVDATGGSGGNVTGHGSTGGSGGGGGIGTGPDGGKTGGTGGYFAGGAVDWNQINVSGGGEGGMGYFGGGGGGSVVETSKNYWSGGGGGGGASYAGGVPSSFLINSSIDDASVTNIISQLNTDPDTVDTAFVTCVSAQKTGEKEQPYWVGHQYDGNYPAQH